ncbi:MAG: rod shape-determining protein RodA [Nitrospinota bacterium]
MRSYELRLDRRLLVNFDWPLLVLALILCGTGVLMVYSATAGSPSPTRSELYWRQLTWIGLGVLGMFLVAFLNYRTIGRYAYVLYGLGILFLLVVLLFGKGAFGSQRWLVVGGLRLQPSEFVKLSLILALARYFEGSKYEGRLGLRQLLTPGLLVLVPFILVAEQPDLGTALVLLLIFTAIVFVAGVRWKTMAWIGGSLMGILPLLWSLLHDYQKKRILTLIYPGAEPLGAGYQSIQSKIAVGSGGLWGKGLLAGTQSRLHFLPAKHTDFIFSVLAEELGFMGVVALLVLLLLLVLRGFDIALHTRDKMGALIATGVVSMIGLSTILNIGMTMGLMPIVGLPLPLVSYGGSSIVATLVGVGLLLNLRMRRFTFQSL